MKMILKKDGDIVKTKASMVVCCEYKNILTVSLGEQFRNEASNFVRFQYNQGAAWQRLPNNFTSNVV